MIDDEGGGAAASASAAAAAAAAAAGSGRSGLAASARRLAVLAGDVAETRLSLAAIELEEQRLHLARQFIGMAWTLFLAGLALVLAGAWAVLACPPEWRTTLVGALALVLAAAAAVSWRLVRQRGDRQPPPFHYTLTELRKDLALLRGTGDRP